MYKCLNNSTYGKAQLQYRRKRDFILPKLRTEQLKRIFRYSAAQIWNNLSQDVWDSANLALKESL